MYKAIKKKKKSIHANYYFSNPENPRDSHFLIQHLAPGL